jgi:predicted ABC-type ATPase
VKRVLERVRQGGHNVPEETIRRRYRAGLLNFFTLYRPLADEWQFFDNSNPANPHLLASGGSSGLMTYATEAWSEIDKGMQHG